MATNIAVWLRLLVWETARSWHDVNHANVNASERFPPDGYNMTAHALFSDGRHEVYGKIFNANFLIFRMSTEDIPFLYYSALHPKAKIRKRKTCK